MLKTTETVHHVVPQCRNGSDHQDNLQFMESVKHIAHHQLFSNMMLHEIIQKLTDARSQTLSNDFKINLFKSLVEEDTKYYYKKHVLK